MKFTCTVTINLPREKGLELFDNPDNLKHWQDGFVSFTHVSGTAGQAGAKSKIRYNMRGREFDLLETITVRNFPDEFSGRYEHAQMTNSLKNIFVAPGPNQTRWDATVEYTEMKSFLLRLMAKLMPGMMRKPVQKWMNQFKDFAEKNTPIV